LTSPTRLGIRFLRCKTNEKFNSGTNFRVFAKLFLGFARLLRADDSYAARISVHRPKFRLNHPRSGRWTAHTGCRHIDENRRWDSRFPPLIRLS
jgi:hypothetical protein